MDIHLLANVLRQRLYSYARGEVEWKELTAFLDFEIIDKCVRCPKCGELYVPMKWILTSIRLSDTVEDFLNLTDGREAHLHEYTNEIVEDFLHSLRPHGYSHPYGTLGPPTTYGLEDLPEENLFEDE